MRTLVQRLSGASPLGPLFSKELRVTARRKRTYYLRFLYLLALLGVLLMVYASMRFVRGEQSVAELAHQNAFLGAAFFATFCWYSMIAMGLIGPILTATAINSERLHKTLSVLLMTPITSWQIISGKLFSRLLIALTLLSLSLPVLAIVRLLGGVEIEQVFAAVSICIVTVLVGAVVSLFFSTLMNRAYTVILLSYAFLIFVWILVPFLTFLVIAAVDFPSPSHDMERLLIKLASIWELPMNMAGVSEPGTRAMAGFFPWWGSCLFWLCFCALMLLWSSAILRRMARKEHEGGAPSTPHLPSGLPVARPLAAGGAVPAAPAGAPPPPLPAVLSYRSSLPGGRERTVADNPVLWRELRKPLTARRWQSILSTVLLVGLLAGIYALMAASGRGHYSPLSDPDSQIGFAFVFCFLLNMLFCVISGTAIAQEKESDTWTLLLATPLSATQIITGKLLGLGRRMLWPSVLVIAHFLIFFLFGVISANALVVILYLTFSTNVIWLATGLYLSLRSKTVTLAIILNLLGPILAYLVPLVVLVIIDGLFSVGGDLPEVVGVYTPYAYFANVIDRLNGDAAPRDIYMPYLKQISVGQFYLASFLLGLVHLVASSLVIWITIRTFDRIVGRAPQRVHARLGGGAMAMPA